MKRRIKMLDLDKYINNSMRIKIFGEEYDILEPTIGMNMEIDRIESDLTRKNLHRKRLDTAAILLNNNRQGRVFTIEELKTIPFEALSVLIAEIVMFRLQADENPNLESQSQMEK